MEAVEEAMKSYSSNDFFQTLGLRERQIVAFHDLVDPVHADDGEMSIDLTLD